MRSLGVLVLVLFLVLFLVLVLSWFGFGFVLVLVFWVGNRMSFVSTALFMHFDERGLCSWWWILGIVLS